MCGLVLSGFAWCNLFVFARRCRFLGGQRGQRTAAGPSISGQYSAAEGVSSHMVLGSCLRVLFGRLAHVEVRLWQLSGAVSYQLDQRFGEPSLD